MSDTIKNALLVAIAALTLVNTVILLTDDSPSYEKNSVSNTAAINATPAATPVANPAVQQPTAPEPVDLGPKTTIQFAEMEHDFGVIEQNSTNPKTFSFTNTGDAPLIISNAKGSCGCTVPEYPREPIAPGESGEIKVVYSPGTQANQQSKTVTITANTEPATTVLRISANVTPGENNTAPIQVGS